MTDNGKRIFAFRRWYGIGPGGRDIEEWTQQKIGSYLGVSERTVRRWVNEEPAPIFEGLSTNERRLLYGMAMFRGEERVVEYLTLLDLDGSFDGEPSSGGYQVSTEPESEQESEPFAGLDEDFSW
jgi:hypothetical protein